MTGELSRLAVCLPTVPQREAVLVETLAQWRAIGVEPLVALQPAAWRCGSRSQFRTATRALDLALATDCPLILLTEDDVDLSSRLLERLPALAGAVLETGRPISLYAPYDRHYAAKWRANPPEGVWPAVNVGSWYGGQGLLMRRDFVAERRETAPKTSYGWDVHYKLGVRARGWPLYLAVPNLVQQRDVRSVFASNGGRHRSTTFAP